MSVLVFEGVAKSLPPDVFGRRAQLLADVSFSVNSGGCHGFVGANGAGKSTSLRLAIGAMRPTIGSVLLRGKLPTLPQARRGVGYAPDLVALDGSLSAAETLQLHWHLLGRRGSPPSSALEEVQLDHRRDERIGTFSKGMVQRLSLAIALLGEPDFIVLDEPMSGLDPSGRHLVRTIIRNRAAQGATVLFSSHVLGDVEDLCSDVTVIDRGKTLYCGAISRLVGPSNGHVLTLDVSEAHDIGSLSRHGLEAKDGRGIATVADDNALVALLADATRVGARVIGVETHRRSLEEAVLSLVSETT
jgi:ABC-2 type transport system ATP-binding protein